MSLTLGTEVIRIVDSLKFHYSKVTPFTNKEMSTMFTRFITYVYLSHQGTVGYGFIEIFLLDLIIYREENF